MKKTVLKQGVSTSDEDAHLFAHSPNTAQKCSSASNAQSVKKTRAFDYEAGRQFLDSLGIKDPFPYVADDFDDPLPEDFLLRPLP